MASQAPKATLFMHQVEALSAFLILPQLSHPFQFPLFVTSESQGSSRFKEGEIEEILLRKFPGSKEPRLWLSLENAIHGKHLQ